MTESRAPQRQTVRPGVLAIGPVRRGAAPRRPTHGSRPAAEPLLRHVVGGVLRNERRSQRRTLRQIAGTAGISVQYLSEVERGRKEPSSEVLAATAGALGLRLVDLLARAHGLLAEREVRVVTLTSDPRPAPQPAVPRTSRSSGLSNGPALMAA